jgi:hypothetical protein
LFYHIYLSTFTKKTVLLVVIAVGTFGLALAFAGNDLVNFIGVLWQHITLMKHGLFQV